MKLNRTDPCRLRRKLSAISLQISAGAHGTQNRRRLPRLFHPSFSVALAALLSLAALPASAASPLALRVEILPTSIAADGTVTTLEVQLAPPDRGRIGRQARMRVKLFQGNKTVAHILKDIDFDAQGVSRAEYTWPPGRYDINLEVESLQGTAKGLWIGQIEIPESLDQVVAPPAATIETPATEPIVAPPPSPPKVDTGAEAIVVPVLDQAEIPEPENPQAASSAAAADSPAQEPVTPPPVPAPAVLVPATAPPPSQSPTAVPDPMPQAEAVVPPPQLATASQPSGPVFALVLVVDRSDFTTADRAAGVVAEIEARTGGVTPIVIRPEDPNPTLAIDQALAAVRPHMDARAIVVVTDGRGKASRSDWKRTSALAGQDGIPIIVVGLWNKQFDPGMRKQLSRLASESGGKSYLLQPSESSARALANVETALAEVN